METSTWSRVGAGAASLPVRRLKGRQLSPTQSWTFRLQRVSAFCQNSAVWGSSSCESWVFLGKKLCGGFLSWTFEGFLRKHIISVTQGRCFALNLTSDKKWAYLLGSRFFTDQVLVLLAPAGFSCKMFLLLSGSMWSMAAALCFTWKRLEFSGWSLCEWIFFCSSSDLILSFLQLIVFYFW